MNLSPLFMNGGDGEPACLLAERIGVVGRIDTPASGSRPSTLTSVGLALLPRTVGSNLALFGDGMGGRQDTLAGSKRAWPMTYL